MATCTGRPDEFYLEWSVATDIDRYSLSLMTDTATLSWGRLIYEQIVTKKVKIPKGQPNAGITTLTKTTTRTAHISNRKKFKANFKRHYEVVDETHDFAHPCRTTSVRIDTRASDGTDRIGITEDPNRRTVGSKTTGTPHLQPRDPVQSIDSQLPSAGSDTISARHSMKSKHSTKSKHLPNTKLASTELPKATQNPVTEKSPTKDKSAAGKRSTSRESPMTIKSPTPDKATASTHLNPDEPVATGQHTTTRERPNVDEQNFGNPSSTPSNPNTDQPVATHRHSASKHSNNRAAGTAEKPPSTNESVPTGKNTANGNPELTDQATSKHSSGNRSARVKHRSTRRSGSVAAKKSHITRTHSKSGGPLVTDKPAISRKHSKSGKSVKSHHKSKHSTSHHPTATHKSLSHTHQHPTFKQPLIASKLPTSGKQHSRDSTTGSVSSAKSTKASMVTSVKSSSRIPGFLPTIPGFIGTVKAPIGTKSSVRSSKPPTATSAKSSSRIPGLLPIIPSPIHSGDSPKTKKSSTRSTRRVIVTSKKTSHIPGFIPTSTLPGGERAIQTVTITRPGKKPTTSHVTVIGYYSTKTVELSASKVSVITTTARDGDRDHKFILPVWPVRKGTHGCVFFLFCGIIKIPHPPFPPIPITRIIPPFPDLPTIHIGVDGNPTPEPTHVPPVTHKKPTTTKKTTSKTSSTSESSSRKTMTETVEIYMVTAVFDERDSSISEAGTAAVPEFQLSC